MKKDKLLTLRHSCEHVLTQAMIRLYPGLLMAMGPATEDGFYFDFEYKKAKISKADFPKIEKEMERIIKENLPFKKKILDVKTARKLFKDNPYKQEWLDEIEKRGEKAVVYWTGKDFVDLCSGPHLKSTGEIGSFKLLSVAGAYWRGDEKNPMLTRIYGTCFPSQKELNQYLKLQEEAKKRDHRKLGKKMGLFHFSPTAPGMPFWHPKGVIIWNELLKFWRKVQAKYDYQEVKAPELLSVNVFKQSGHWDHYKDYMFFTEWDKNEKYALKPMDCPGEIEIYRYGIKSYRHLPLRFAEIGLVHRKEKKGELNGLFRVAHITQDDAHIFATEDQIQKEVSLVIKLTQEIYRPFKLNYDIYLSTRPADFMGNIKSWDKAEKSLKKALRANKIPFEIKEGEGAFYGPKIDYNLKDALGRTWQCATIQLDFFMPEKFNLKYIDKNGKERKPVIIHRTIMGALERFIGILIEHYAGAFPVWLSPIQVVIIPIASRHLRYGQSIIKKLKEENIRIKLDNRSETVQAKIRDAELEKIPFMLILGDKEMKKKKVSVRQRSKGNLGQMTLKKFVEKLNKEIEAKI
jgi:threonyl-tRNA synthetase